MRIHFKLLLTGTLLAFLSACATPSPPLPPSLHLPQPVTDLKALRKGDKVFLTWSAPIQTTDEEGIREAGPTLICRNLQEASDIVPVCNNPIAEMPTPKPIAVAKDAKGPSPRITAHFTDTLPPNFPFDKTKLLAYTVEVLNTNRRSAGPSNIAAVLAAPTLAPPQDLQAELTPTGVILTWTGILNVQEPIGLMYLYRVYRRQEGSTNEVVVGEMRAGQSAQGRMVDPNFEWEKTYTYRVNVATVVHRAGQATSVEGADSPEIKVVAHDTFPPLAPVELQAVFSGAGQLPFVDLTWTANTEADLAGYNVYRREADGTPVKLNSDLVITPSFRDQSPAAGKTYLYSATAVDLRGNESTQSAEARENIP